MTDSGSSPAIEALLDAALQQFGLHGFAKTTMTDIANASGVSRTSLYNHFPTKEDVFRAISQRLNARVHDEVVQAVSDKGHRDERLLKTMHARVSWVYELLHASQFGRELIDEKNRICGGQVLAANDRFARVIADILAEYPNRTLDPQALAAILIQSVNGVLQTATSRDAAHDAVDMLVRVFSLGLNARQPRPGGATS